MVYYLEIREFYSTEEAAKFLKISLSTFQRLRRAGAVIPDKFGKNNAVFYSEKQLKNILTVRSNYNSKGVETVRVEVTEDFHIEDSETDIYLSNVLPYQHYNEITKLGDKLQIAEPNQDFKTAFNKDKTIFTFARLDYDDEVIKFDRKFDLLDKLILNAIYSFYRAGYEYFTPRNILQHVFGNVPDHFQEEIVKLIEKRMERMGYMKLTFTLKDRLGNDKYIKINGEQYHPVALKENLLDMSILELKSNKFGKRMFVYKLNRKSPLFKYAESLNQITSWSVHYMAVPCRKTIQNAIITNYLLIKIALVKNKHNHYLNTGILFETLYEELNLDVSTRKKKKVIRDNIKIMFEYWVKVNLLISYKFIKNRQAFYKIMFNVNLSEVYK